MNGRGMADVLSQLGPGWADAMSESGEGSRRYKEYFGFFFDQKVQLVKALGIYPKAHEFFRPPYGAQFRSTESNLTFNLVACHIVYGKSERERLAEIRHLGEVLQYFEGVTGNQGITMIAGDFNEDKNQAFQALYDLNEQEVIPAEGTTIGSRGPDHAFDHIFLPRPLRDLEVDAGVDYWTTDYASTRTTVSDHFPVYVVLRTRR
jgi:endonuclease/exonuclease/phosphatase family metal-dependent hydrolase